ncbi:hypothetical protein Q3G72_022404 [Acer saccharum]|nr:hypothetical protein Q3G72_022404 [Acer saccharum]
MKILLQLQNFMKTNQHFSSEKSAAADVDVPGVARVSPYDPHPSFDTRHHAAVDLHTQLMTDLPLYFQSNDHNLRNIANSENLAQKDLYNAEKELVTYIGPEAMMPVSQSQPVMPTQMANLPSVVYNILSVP